MLSPTKLFLHGLDYQLVFQKQFLKKVVYLCGPWTLTLNRTDAAQHIIILITMLIKYVKIK